MATLVMGCWVWLCYLRLFYNTQQATFMKSNCMEIFSSAGHAYLYLSGVQVTIKVKDLVPIFNSLLVLAHHYLYLKRFSLAHGHH